ncbi:MAG: CHASE2 domain-containing protein [Candidatus Riflebacteria bacterium]|nr:CHASE2 domain-containing protein [Candidatus Riflebacteria bacterium]
MKIFFSEKKWIFFSLVFAFFSLFLFYARVLVNVDEYLTTLIFQLGYNEKSQKEKIVLIKKDEKTSALLAKNPGRREFASVIKFLGQTQQVPVIGNNEATLKLIDFRLGLFSSPNKPVFSLSWPGTSNCENYKNPSFFRFSENFAFVHDFLQFPSEALASFSPSLKELSQDQIKKLGIFLENIRNLQAKCTFKVLPDAETIFSIILQLKIELPPSYEVPPANVIGLDFLLQGDHEKEEDDLLRSAIASSQIPIVLAAQMTTDSEYSYEFMNHSPNSSGTDIVNLGKNEIQEKQIEIFPQKTFLNSNSSVGFINSETGSNRFIRRLPLFQYYPEENRLEPGFSLLTAVLALDKSYSGPEKTPYMNSMKQEMKRIFPLIKDGTYQGDFNLFDRKIPCDERGRMEIYFYGSTQTDLVCKKRILKSFSLYECFDGDTLAYHSKRIPGSAEKLGTTSAHLSSLSRWQNCGNQVCLVAPFEKTDLDFFETPLSYKTPFTVVRDQITGAEVNANAILTILEKRFLQYPSIVHTTGFVLFISTLFGVFLSIFNPLAATFIAVLFMGGTFGLGFFLYNSLGIIFYFSPCLIVFPLTLGFHIIDHFLTQRRKTQETKAMFQRFVSADVVQYMLDHPQAVKPGGQNVEMTIFFSDVAGFTSISEALTPEKLVVLLNEYLGSMTRLLFKHGGTLDKFIGDAVMAFWNYPREQEDHAVRACLCALEMQRKILELQKGWAERKLPKVAARCGINTANVIVGYMGAIEAQMNFTCMGDGVNLASRLEGANKEYGTFLMISEKTYLRAKERVSVRFLDFLAVKGKAEPVKVFELVSEKGDEPAEWSKLISLYDTGIALHLDKKWDEAIQKFEEILKKWPSDGPSKTYIKRCQEYKETPPPENWDGSYHLTHK